MTCFLIRRRPERGARSLNCWPYSWRRVWCIYASDHRRATMSKLDSVTMDALINCYLACTKDGSFNAGMSRESCHTSHIYLSLFRLVSWHDKPQHLLTSSSCAFASTLSHFLCLNHWCFLVQNAATGFSISYRYLSVRCSYLSTDMITLHRHVMAWAVVVFDRINDLSQAT